MHVEYMHAIRERYKKLGYPPYRWFEAEDAPALAPLKKPMRESKLGMLSTSGAYVVGQEAYFYKDDTSIRAIDKDTPSEQIHFSHITENYLGNPRKDPNCIFPIDTLKRAEAEGLVGELAPEFFSCMGGIYSQRRVNEELIPAVTEQFIKQAVDTVLLVPM